MIKNTLAGLIVTDAPVLPRMAFLVRATVYLLVADVPMLIVVSLMVRAGVSLFTNVTCAVSDHAVRSLLLGVVSSV